MTTREERSEILLDLSDLSGDEEPVSLQVLLEENLMLAIPLSDEQIAELEDLDVGETVFLSIGGGASAVRRVK